MKSACCSDGRIRLFILGVSFLLSSISEATGPLRKSSANPRYFTDDSGKAIYLTGAHTWANFQDMSTTGQYPPPVYDYNAYLNFLQTQGHNFIRLWVAENARGGSSISNEYMSPSMYVRSGTCCEQDGIGNKFDVNTFNQAYFDRLRQRVQAAQSKGIYVSVMLFNGWSIESKGFTVTSPWTYHPYNKNNNINGINGDDNGDGQGLELYQMTGSSNNNAVHALQKAYVQKVISTVGDLDNVLYEISNEGGGYSNAWQYDMINFIHQTEAGRPMQHPVGMTFQWPDGSNTTLLNSPADWISPNPSAPNGYNYEDNPPPADGTKVIISDTDHLWGVGGDQAWAWKSFTRGIHPIYMDEGIMTFPATGDASHTSARTAMGATLRYAQKMGLVSMTPRGDLTSTGYALAKPGTEYLVYQPNGGSFSVTLAAAAYAVEWYNVNANSTSSASSVTGNGGSMNFSPPFSGPAVVYLKSGSAPSFDFNLSASPASLAVAPGNKVTSSLTATLVAGSAQAVTFSASGLPTGTSASFSSPSCTVTCSSTLTLQTAASTPAGAYSVTVTAAGGGASHGVPLSFTVSPTGSPNLAAGILPTAGAAVGGDGAGTLAAVTDLTLDSAQFASLPPGCQWVRIDLGGLYSVNDVKLWHYYQDSRTYNKVIVRLSTTADFSSGVTTIFNNDAAGDCGLGRGSQSLYSESPAGKDIPVAPVNARYVQFWSSGSAVNNWNHYVEAEVFGTPISDSPACDVNGDGARTVTDVQLAVNQALGTAACKPAGQAGSADINHDGQCSVIDVQRISNAALGGACVSP